jgi:hypothetical protein
MGAGPGLQPVGRTPFTAVRSPRADPLVGGGLAAVMAKRSLPAFPRVLKEPILKPLMFSLGQVPGNTDEERKTAYEHRLQERHLENLFELLKHYEIKPPKKHPWFAEDWLEHLPPIEQDSNPEAA